MQALVMGLGTLIRDLGPRQKPELGHRPDVAAIRARFEDLADRGGLLAAGFKVP